jgi:hypothetical protein
MPLSRMLSFSRKSKNSASVPAEEPEANPFAAAPSAASTEDAPSWARAAAPAAEAPVPLATAPFQDAAPQWSRPAANSSDAPPQWAGGATSRPTSSRTSFSLFGSDPDKAHDKLLSGVKISPSVTAAKDSLRKLRNAAESTATFYH